VETAAGNVDGDMDGGVINTLSRGEVAVLDSISGAVGGVLGLRVFRGGEVGGVLEFGVRLRGNISAEGPIWLCVGVEVISMVGK